MPKALGKNRLCCREWMYPPSPPSSPTHSEDEGDEQDSSAIVVAALLDLVANNLFFVFLSIRIFVCILCHSRLESTGPSHFDFVFLFFRGFRFLSIFDAAPISNLPTLAAYEVNAIVRVSHLEG